MPFVASSVQSRRFALCVVDLVLVAAAFLAAHAALAYGWMTGSAMETAVHHALIPALFTFVGIFAVGGYQPDADRALEDSVQRLVLALLLGAIASMLVSIVVFQNNRPAAPLIAGVAFSGAALVGFRALLRKARLDLLESRVLVVGAGRRARDLADAIGECGASTIIGFVANPTDEAGCNEALPAPAVALQGDAGSLSIADIARKLRASEVVVAIDDRRNGSFPTKELMDCRMRGVQVIDANSFIERETGKVDLDNLYPSWLIFSPGFKAGHVRDAVKRLVDIVLSLVLLVFFAPVLALTAIAIKLDSRGPVFYRQVRVGKGGKLFKLMKFRSMRTDAEAGGAVWARQNDDRVTRVGRFIRKTRIDETPQALNVLAGDMSFVGPRPERPEFIDQLSREIDLYDERHRVKPGITGWAQVNYPYGASIEDAREKLKYDLFYMKNYSPIFDLSIVVQTIRVMLFALGGR